MSHTRTFSHQLLEHTVPKAEDVEIRLDEYIFQNGRRSEDATISLDALEVVTECDKSICYFLGHFEIAIDSLTSTELGSVIGR